MKSENFVTIQGWMCNELELKGNELLVYALIYGFSQDGVSKYAGGRKYIAETFNISLPTVDKALQNLIGYGYIEKYSSNNYINTDTYQINAGVVKKLYEGSKETLRGGSKETLLNNIENLKNNKNKTNTKVLVQNFAFGVKQQPQKQSLYSKCTALIGEFTDDIKIKDALTTYLNMMLEGKNLQYANQWKGLLTKLKRLDGDILEIVQQSIDRGYRSFFPVNNYGGKVGNAVTDIEHMEGNHPKVDKEKLKEDIANGNVTYF